VAGIAVVTLGHAHPQVAEAISKQAATLVQTSNLYYTRPMAELSERLTSLLGWEDGRVFFANSGAEANECAIKVVRKWSRKNFSAERYEMIAALGSFHGRTLETLAATGQPAKWETFAPLPPGFSHVAYDDPNGLESAVTTRTAAVMLEPVLGEGGVVVPSSGYLPAVRKICDTHSLAFVADEIQTGLGRCGHWFAFQETQSVPDVITLAKPLANGLPLGACIAHGDLAEAFEPGDHATTFGGGAVVCAAALAVLDIIEKEDLVGNARQLGTYLYEKLEDLTSRHEVATSVRGKGLLLALQLSADVARKVAEIALSKGLLVNDVGPSTVRLTPPLIVDRAQCDEALSILDEALEMVDSPGREV
ncbi:MAG: aminotransferase class III-fold pyridoxal phosphate-dependent enzyme, partial [Acidimicrobiia bacterium]